MENTTHTPAPWSFDQETAHTRATIDAAGKRVGVFMEGYSPSDPDGRLLALAPQMLETLKAAAPYMKELQNENHSDRSVGICEDHQLTKAFEMVFNLIALAEGKEIPYPEEQYCPEP